MTLLEWTKAISDELTAAGFNVSQHEGFPLVNTPEGLEEKVRILKLKLSLPTSRRIYSEGILFTPLGSGN